MIGLLVEAAGWGGALLILSAYLLLRRHGWWHGAIPSASLNVIWRLIGVAALLRIARRRRTEGVS